MHFLRDIHDLKKLYPDDVQVWQWAKDVKQIYDRAKAALAPDPRLPLTQQHAQRVALQHVFEQELWQVCAPFVQTQAPMHTLCERVERFLPELFVFVAYPGVPSDNIWPNAVCVLWSSLAKSVGERAVPMAVLPAWDWQASSAPGTLKVSILSRSVSLSSRPYLP